MKIAIYFILLILVGTSAFSQVFTYPMLAKQFSTSYVTGSARMQGLGGTQSVLGADLSSIAGNAAGLGFYSRSEVGLNVAMNSSVTDADYLNQSTNSSNSLFHMPNFGIVISGDYLSSSSWKGAFGIGYSRQVVISQPLTVEGTNNRSSYLDFLIQKAGDKGATGATLDDEFDTFNVTADSPEAAAYQAYLINPNASSGGAPFERYLPNLPTSQFIQSVNSGAVSQWDISYGAAYQEKFYVGLGLHFTRLNSTQSQLLEEQFLGNRFVSGYSFKEQLITTGSGFSASLGVIYKVKPNLRVALNVQTPTYYDQINERFTGSISPQIESIPVPGGFITGLKQPVKLTPNEFSYQMVTPFRISGGMAYFFGKRGLISADVELLNFGGMSVGSLELGPSANQQFKNKYNAQISRNFQTALNLKVGAEFRVSSAWTVRGGAGMFGSGFSSTFDSIDRNQFQVSGGLGYRSAAYYIDFAIVQRMWKDAFTPYVLKNAAEYSSAALMLSNSQITVGGGVFF